MNATISARILSLVATGMTLDKAVDAVLGQGSYEKMANDVYTALRSGGR